MALNLNHAVGDFGDFLLEQPRDEMRAGCG